MDSKQTKIFSDINKDRFTNFPNSGLREEKIFFPDNNKEIFEFPRIGMEQKRKFLGSGPDTFGKTIGVEI